MALTITATAAIAPTDRSGIEADRGFCRSPPSKTDRGGETLIAGVCRKIGPCVPAPSA
jgi:hypothetical protein